MVKRITSTKNANKGIVLWLSCAYCNRRGFAALGVTARIRRPFVGIVAAVGRPLKEWGQGSVTGYPAFLRRFGCC
ncbi:hypothetical protein DF3PA_30149 [Candidatus Defluviicoccus seviourii]|uniref:Uncharacterized protein n=2 Tax=root TaxID=1 RepID=A0A564WF59_9PROT|nr:hypothetical protein DF3PB_2980004 [uncultured Defluviicoccus sp.]VUX46921.1 hypothetical protein DF3PA_30149 [Candidatus Defluviicoccus seviourii]